MPNKTISLPDDVVPIIDTLYAAAKPGLTFRQQLLVDAELARGHPASVVHVDMEAVAERIERSAPW
jgi:hypothetical protein